MGDLTKNFSAWEFVCPCCGGLPPIETLMRLVVPLQKLRDQIGHPIHVHSGYRCPKHNKDVGAKSTSQHVKGLAADVHADTFTPEELAQEAVQIEEFRKGGIGVYDWGCHLDVRGKTARWGKRWRTIITFLGCLLFSGCLTTMNHCVKIEADKFIGTVPGFGEINVENFRYWKAPAKAKEGENVYEVPEMFWWDGKE